MRQLRRLARRSIELTQRRFVWLINVGALAFIAAVTLTAHALLREQITDESRTHAIRTAELLAQSSYAPRLAAPTGPRLQQDLAPATDAAIGSGAIAAATIWHPDGTIAYSSETTLTHGAMQLPAQVRRALRGSEVVRHTSESDAPGDAPVDRLDITMPVRNGRTIVAVVELEVPYASVAADINHRTHRLDLVIAAAGALVYLFLFPVILQGGRILRRHMDPEAARMTEELEDAIAAGHLRVEFQPIVDMRTGATIAAEALVRWDHPTRGAIPPDRFIPVAERSPLFWDFTMHVLNLALAECAACRRAGHALAVAVNIASADLLDPRLPDALRRLLAEHDLPPEALELEVTERAIMEESKRAAAVLSDVGAVGIARIAIDDFGTGYSSLARVRSLPIDVLKIDRSFVQEMEASGDSALVRSVIALAHNLGLAVVAEGVESDATARRLAQLGCDCAQGYWFSRPLRPEALRTWLDDHRRDGVDGLAAVSDDDRRAGPGRRADDYFSVAFKNAPEPMLIADDGGRWVDANLAACALLGVYREEVRRGGWAVEAVSGSRTNITFDATANVLPGLHLFVVRSS